MSSIAQALTDKDFLNAHPDDQKKYLSSIDQDFAKGSPQDQQAYLNHILEPQRRAQSAQPTQFENNAPKVPNKYGFTVSNLLKSGIQGVRDVGHFAKEAAGDISNPNKPLFFGGAETGPKESTFHKYVIAPSERENERAQQGGQRALESIGHSVAAAIPGIGPWVSGLAERAGTGDVGGAAAQGAAQYFTGKGLEKIGSKATSASASGLPMIGKTAGEVIGEESLKPITRNIREAGTKAIYTPEGEVKPGASSAAEALKHPTQLPGRAAVGVVKKLFPPPPAPEPAPVYPGAPLPDPAESYAARGEEANKVRQMNEVLDRRTAREAKAAAKTSVAEPPPGEGPAPPIAQVVKLPIPRQPLPGENPGYMASIPRGRLLDLARQGRPGAGEQLRHIGKTPLYVPEEYPGPRQSEGLPHIGAEADLKPIELKPEARPQYTYKPSEKASTMSAERPDLGREFETAEASHEIARNKDILRNPRATAEERRIARDRLQDAEEQRSPRSGLR